jgi:hypothetical protein
MDLVLLSLSLCVILSVADTHNPTSKINPVDIIEAPHAAKEHNQRSPLHAPKDQG